MGTAEMILTGAALSADAFAASVCRAASGRQKNTGDIIVPPLVYGIFQAFMPLIGWLAGKSLAGFFSAADHWIAFALLSFIGARAFFSAVFHGEDDTAAYRRENDDLFLTAAATSIDALAAGAGLAFADADIAFFCISAGAVTFLVCVPGSLIGKRLGEKFGRAAGAVGGIVLIAIGTKILADHLSGG